jgi:hypothetical protein
MKTGTLLFIITYFKIAVQFQGRRYDVNIAGADEVTEGVVQLTDTGVSVLKFKVSHHDDDNYVILFLRVHVGHQ